MHDCCHKNIVFRKDGKNCIQLSSLNLCSEFLLEIIYTFIYFSYCFVINWCLFVIVLLQLWIHGIQNTFSNNLPSEASNNLPSEAAFSLLPLHYFPLLCDKVVCQEIQVWYNVQALSQVMEHISRDSCKNYTFQIYFHG